MRDIDQMIIKQGWVAIISIVIVFMGCCHACKSGEDRKMQSNVTIRGRIIGNMGIRDSVRIIFGGYIPGNWRDGIKDTTLYTGADGRFLFQSTRIHKSNRVSIISYKKREGEMGQRWKDVLRKFIVEPGDDIHIDIDESKEDLDYQFSGTGAAKFRIQWQNIQSGYKSNRRAIHTRYGLHFYELTTKLHIADSIRDLQIKNLETSKASLSERAFKLIKADIYGETGKNLKTFFVSMHTDTCSDVQLHEYQKLFDKSLAIDLQSDILAGSPNYILFLSSMAVAQLQLEHPKDPAFKYDNIYSEGFSELCHIWRTQYTGKLREQLLLYNLQNLRVQDTYGMQDCLQLSRDLIQSPELKAIFDRMYGRKLRGASVFDFNLPNTEGERVRLSDFRGKVVYLDIWFTGCSGCLYLAKEVDHDVYPMFKNNPDVVFVSISGDKSRARWLKSVDSERYGLKDYVNLYTEGLGFKHKFMLYYDIEGGPTTMIIDRKGRVYSSAPPKHGKSKELIALIKEALKN